MSMQTNTRQPDQVEDLAQRLRTMQGNVDRPATTTTMTKTPTRNRPVSDPIEDGSQAEDLPFAEPSSQPKDEAIIVVDPLTSFFRRHAQRAKAVGLFVAGNMIGPPALDWLAARMAHDPRLRWYARPLRDAGALALRAATFYYGASMSSSQLADMVAGLKQQIEALRKKEADDIAAIENSIQR